MSVKPYYSDAWLEIHEGDCRAVMAEMEPESVQCVRKDVRCRSVGFVLADDKQGIVLASSVNGANATGIVIIPASQVKSRRRLR